MTTDNGDNEMGWHSPGAGICPADGLDHSYEAARDRARDAYSARAQEACDTLYAILYVMDCAEEITESIIMKGPRGAATSGVAIRSMAKASRDLLRIWRDEVIAAIDSIVTGVRMMVSYNLSTAEVIDALGLDGHEGKHVADEIRRAKRAQ